MSFWSKLGKIALKAAPIAASFIPGLGPIAAAAIGAASGGAGAAVDHKGLGGILTGAALGAAPGAAKGLIKGGNLGSRIARTALGAGGSTAGGGGGARVTGYDPGNVGEDGSVWSPDGTYIGPSTYSTSDGSSGGAPSWLEPAMDIGAGAIKDLIQNKQLKDQRRAQLAAGELNLDPYRNLEDQSSAMGRFDMQANGNFTAPPTRLVGPYADRYGSQIEPGPSWNPSEQTRGVARAAMTQVAGGRGQAPSMTDSNNYGKTTSVSAPPPTPAGAGMTPDAMLAQANLNPLLKRLLLRQRPPQPPVAMNSSSWLA
jgi:hypothetical protein